VEYIREVERRQRAGVTCGGIYEPGQGRFTARGCFWNIVRILDSLQAFLVAAGRLV